MFDLGFDVPTTTEYQKNMDILLSMFDEDVSFDEVQSIEFDRDVSSSNREALQELDQAFFVREDRKCCSPKFQREIQYCLGSRTTRAERKTVVVYQKKHQMGFKTVSRCILFN